MSKEKKQKTKRMRTKKEIEKALDEILDNTDLFFGYKDDVSNVLIWVLGGEDFDGIESKH